MSALETCDADAKTVDIMPREGDAANGTRDMPRRDSDDATDVSSSTSEEENDAVVFEPTPTATVAGCSDVQVGPRTLYNAPVTINQYLRVTDSGPQKMVNAGWEAANLCLDHTTTAADSRQEENSREEYMKCGFRQRRCMCVVGLLLLGLLVVLLGVGIHFSVPWVTSSPVEASTKPTTPRLQETPAHSPVDAVILNTPAIAQDPSKPADVNITLASGRRIISKEDWEGFPTQFDRPHWKLEHPTPYVVIVHTVTGTCSNAHACAKICRNIQYDHVGGKFEMADIGFNFLVGGDGNVYEGRGWDLTNAYTGLPYLKRHNLAVAFIGNFVVNKLTPEQIAAALDLLELGVKLEKLSPAYKLIAHNDTTVPTLSPGRNVYSVIKTWTHFWVPAQ